jgi:hypothetical protein
MDAGQPEHAVLLGQTIETLALVERKVTYMVAQSWRAIELLLQPTQEVTADGATLQPRAPLEAAPAPARPTLSDLDRYARYWAGLVPGDPSVRAALIRHIGGRYAFQYAQIANIRAVLAL